MSERHYTVSGCFIVRPKGGLPGPISATPHVNRLYVLKGNRRAWYIETAPNFHDEVVKNLANLTEATYRNGGETYLTQEGVLLGRPRRPFDKNIPRAPVALVLIRLFEESRVCDCKDDGLPLGHECMDPSECDPMRQMAVPEVELTNRELLLKAISAEMHKIQLVYDLIPISTGELYVGVTHTLVLIRENVEAFVECIKALNIPEGVLEFVTYTVTEVYEDGELKERR